MAHREVVGEEDRLNPTPPNAAARAALMALRVYKTYFSILIAGSCRYEPTCSLYACHAIERFGVARGSWLALKRLLRCHPLSRQFGYDPAPETWPSKWGDMHSTESMTAKRSISSAAVDRSAIAQETITSNGVRS